MRPKIKEDKLSLDSGDEHIQVPTILVWWTFETDP